MHSPARTRGRTGARTAPGRSLHCLPGGHPGPNPYPTWEAASFHLSQGEGRALSNSPRLHPSPEGDLGLSQGCVPVPCTRSQGLLCPFSGLSSHGRGCPRVLPKGVAADPGFPQWPGPRTPISLSSPWAPEAHLRLQWPDTRRVSGDQGGRGPWSSPDEISVSGPCRQTGRRGGWRAGRRAGRVVLGPGSLGKEPLCLGPSSVPCPPGLDPPLLAGLAELLAGTWDSTWPRWVGGGHTCHRWLCLLSIPDQ